MRGPLHIKQAFGCKDHGVIDANGHLIAEFYHHVDENYFENAQANAQEYVALRAEVERLQTTSRCAWCGVVIAGVSPEDRGELALDHLLICPDHPLRQLEKRIAELTAEVERLQTCVHDLKIANSYAVQRIGNLSVDVQTANTRLAGERAEVERLREALAWYAD
jgi:hypothetical protein